MVNHHKNQPQLIGIPLNDFMKSCDFDELGMYLVAREHNSDKLLVFDARKNYKLITTLSYEDELNSFFFSAMEYIPYLYASTKKAVYYYLYKNMK